MCGTAPPDRFAVCLVTQIVEAFSLINWLLRPGIKKIQKIFPKCLQGQILLPCVAFAEYARQMADRWIRAALNECVIRWFRVDLMDSAWSVTWGLRWNTGTNTMQGI